jgi:hypothetical protein
MATSMSRVLPWLCLVLVTGCAAPTVTDAATVGTNDSLQAPTTPTRGEADALLADAHRLAQAHDFNRLCQAVAQDEKACQQVLQWAGIAHAAPSADAPSTLDAHTVPDTRTAQGAEVLHIHGTRADGTEYTNDFSVVRTTTGQIRSQNAVYWYSTFASPNH